MRVRFVAKRLLILLVVQAVFLFTVNTGRAAGKEGSSSRQARAEARQAIPWEKLNDEDRRQVEAVVGRVTVYRRMPIDVVRSSADLYQFVVSRPDVLLEMWAFLDRPGIRVRRTGHHVYRAEDRYGTDLEIDYVHIDPHAILILVDGKYHGPLMRRHTTGRILLLLQSDYALDREGKSRITSRLDIFLQVDRFGTRMLAKIANLIAGDVVDDAFLDTTRFLSELGRLAESDPVRFNEVVMQLDRIEPKVRRELMRIVDGVSRQLSTRDDSRAISR